MENPNGISEDFKEASKFLNIAAQHYGFESYESIRDRTLFDKVYDLAKVIQEETNKAEMKLLDKLRERQKTENRFLIMAILTVLVLAFLALCIKYYSK